MFKKKNKAPERPAGRSFSQCGEDRILAFVTGVLKIDRPYYVDIGAHLPWHLSNTALFYEQGCTGLLVEADPGLAAELLKERPNDKVLNIGITEAGCSSLDFFIFDARTLNTFSKEEADRLVASGKHKLVSTEQVKTLTFMEMFNEFINRTIDILSVDVEGYDYEIVLSIDLDIVRPKVLCIETLTYDTNNEEKKLTKTVDYLKEKGYMVYADTYINTIFVDQKLWRNR